MRFPVCKHTSFQVWAILSVAGLALSFSVSCSKKSDTTSEHPNDVQDTKTEQVVANTENADATDASQTETIAHDEIKADNNKIESGDKKIETGDNQIESGDNQIESGDNQIESGDNDTQSDDDEDDVDCDCGTGGNCEDAPVAWLKDQIDKVTSFGHRHEIQGDLSQAKFSELEPALPFGDLKVTHGNDVVKKIESYFSVNCTQDNPIKKVADGSTVQLVFCSKSERTRDYTDPDYSGTTPIGFYPRLGSNDTCHHQVADVAYLSLVSSKDKNARVYQIGTDVDFGYVDALEEMCRWTYDERASLTLIEAVSKPFMDTKGLYIRTKYFYDSDSEHQTQDSSSEWKISYTTWLFAGDKLRLVKSWEDSNYHYFHEENYDDVCIAYTQSEEYSENYMYYESGEFKPVQKSAHNKAELDKLMSGRP